MNDEMNDKKAESQLKEMQCFKNICCPKSNDVIVVEKKKEETTITCSPPSIVQSRSNFVDDGLGSSHLLSSLSAASLSSYISTSNSESEPETPKSIFEKVEFHSLSKPQRSVSDTLFIKETPQKEISFRRKPLDAIGCGPDGMSFDPYQIKTISKRSWWLIPANHRLKILWDVITVFLSFLSLYETHQSIRDRRFNFNYLTLFCEVWFFFDILLNFVTEHRTSDGQVIQDQKTVWARYLTSWFVVDALSFVPWERVFVKPIIEMQNKRGPLRKLFFRSKSIIRVSRKLRGNHVRLFGRVVNKTKQIGVGSNKLLRLIIKYLPKYILFFRNMRGVLAVRTLRQLHWMRKIFREIWVASSSTVSLTKMKQVFTPVKKKENPKS